MDSRFIERLLQQVSVTEAREISCSECFERLPACVELELADTVDAETALAPFFQHLGQCGVCRDEYETLRDFLRSQPEDPPLAPGSPPVSPA